MSGVRSFHALYILLSVFGKPALPLRVNAMLPDPNVYPARSKSPVILGTR
jgi:hypothetical protein